jgi:adenosine deaminase
MLDYTRTLPKADLHCHIGGCVRASTLEELLPAESREEARHALTSTTLSGAFNIFKLVHAAVSTEAALARVVREAIEDAARDGVVYLELRSTPRALKASANIAAVPLPDGVDESDAARHRYVAVVGAAIVAMAALLPQIVVRLLVSVDRAASLDDFDSCARVAAAWSRHCIAGLAPVFSTPSRLVVGVDVSGDPRVGDARDLVTRLDSMRASGLLISVHLGEISGEAADAEAAAIISWLPDRIGHLAVVGPKSEAALLALGKNQPPIEMCPASNLLTLGLSSLRDHTSLARRIAGGARVAISTDDPAVFKTSLSAELASVAIAFCLSQRQVAALSAAAFDFAFAE